MQHHHGGAGSLSDIVPLMPQPASGTVVSFGGVSPSMQPQSVGTGFEELPADGGCGGGRGGTVNSHDDDVLADGRGASEVGGSGNRWPREETLVLIGIRSEMDAVFRNAALKAPLWEEVSRRLAELGYHRSAQKCKEKFENVDKYYRRTKEGRAGRQDGKSYRFFPQLEALHAAAPPQQHQHQAAAVQGPRPLSMARIAPAHPGVGLLPGLSFSSNSGSESDDESDEEEEAGGSIEGSGMLASGDGGGSNKKLTALFEGMIKLITEKQDAMQRLFLETLDKWEVERTAREEAWRRQEVARINREREQHDMERAAAASRDAAVIAFLQRVGGKSAVLPPSSAIAVPTAMSAHTAPPPHLDASASSLQLVVLPPKAEEGRAGGESSGGVISRWPKEEVQALIQLRMEKDEHYQDMGPKGPLWEDISAGMRRIGYNRSSKRCKEKWENINKYFKKVKESKKRRPEDSKTCPYFHQLDAIYRKKHLAMSGSGSSTASVATMAAAVTATEPENPRRELEGKSSNDFHSRHSVGIGSLVETATATTVLDDSAANKKAEETVMVREPNVQSQQMELTATDETDSDDMEGNYTDKGDDDDGHEDDKMKYKIEFQNPEESGSRGAPAAATTAAAVASSAPTGSTYLAVQ